MFYLHSQCDLSLAVFGFETELPHFEKQMNKHFNFRQMSFSDQKAKKGINPPLMTGLSDILAHFLILTQNVHFILTAFL